MSSLNFSDNSEDMVICDKFNYGVIIFGFFCGIILLFLIYLFYRRDGYIRFIDVTVIFSVALSSIAAAIFVIYKLKITPRGIQPKSIIKRGFIKWEDINMITWKVGIHYSKHGINVGTYNIVKFSTNKKSFFNRTIRYKMWNENLSREMEEILSFAQKEKGIEVKYHNTLA